MILRFALRFFLLIIILNTALSKITTDRNEITEEPDSDKDMDVETTTDPGGMELPVTNSTAPDVEVDNKSAKNNTRLIVDVAIVCDKEFSDLFSHNRKKLLNYWTVRFRHVSMHFLTIPDVEISFHVTSVTAISDSDDQPFIENARQSTTNKISLHRVLPLFSSWVYKKAHFFPKFQIALGVTNAPSDTHGAAAYLPGICSVDHDNNLFGGTLVIHGGSSTNYDLTQGLAQVLGVPYDIETDCTSTGHIMTRNKLLAKPVFSSCSAKYLFKHLRYFNTSCLWKEESPTLPILDPDFDDILPPSVIEKCVARATNPAAAVIVSGNNVCDKVTCFLDDGQTPIQVINIDSDDLENTFCEPGKQCFFGKCTKHGHILVNAGSGHCLLSGNRFNNSDKAIMSPCPRSTTAFDRFHVRGDLGRLLLETPYLEPQEPYLNFKCLRVGRGQEVAFTNCTASTSSPETKRTSTASSVENLPENAGDAKWSSEDPNGIQSTESPYSIEYLLETWKQIHLENNEFMLKHVGTGKCIQHANSNYLVASFDCDQYYPGFRWKFQSVFPSAEMCEYGCIAELKVSLQLRHASENNEFHLTVSRKGPLMVDVFLDNFKEAAIAPAVEISWEMNLKLLRVPHNCFSLTENKTSYKCKLGRLLGKHETALVATLQFDLEQLQLYDDDNTAQDLKLLFNVSASTASSVLRIPETEHVTFTVIHHNDFGIPDKLRIRTRSGMQNFLGIIVASIILGSIALCCKLMKAINQKRAGLSEQGSRNQGV